VGDTEGLFLERDVVHLLVQRLNEADSRGGRSLALLIVLVVAYKVKVVAPIGDGSTLVQGALAHRTDGQARRQGEALLDASQADVQTPGVELDLGASHATHGVHQDHHLGVLLLHQPADVPDLIVADRGGTLAYSPRTASKHE
jgi:hypothetical protein